MANYYVSSFLWSTIAKTLNAVIGFFSIPLLLDYYGEADYGVLAIATACNTYMHLLDLGMNTGAVKYYSQWRHQGKKETIERVARTNITFYLIVALVNSSLLLALAQWGSPVFYLTPGQFDILRRCLLILALFSVLSWGATTFNQLLIAYGKIAFTMQMQCIQSVCKLAIIFVAFGLSLSVTGYFFWLTLIVALLVVPYAWKCWHDGILRNLMPDNYWTGFKTVMLFSLSIFSLSLFQMTASQSRPILLGMFAEFGANTVAEYRILEVLPMFVIQIGLMLSSIFLPKTSELIARGNREEIRDFAYRWTLRTTVLACLLCFPCMIGAREFLTLYVGEQYAYLSTWLILWSATALIQIHNMAAQSLIISTGKTRLLVIATAIGCIVSMGANIVLCRSLSVGSAIVSYLIYVVTVIVFNYACYYRQLLDLDIWVMIRQSAFPTLAGALICVAVVACDRWVSGVVDLHPAITAGAAITIWGASFMGTAIAMRWIQPGELKNMLKKS